MRKPQIFAIAFLLVGAGLLLLAMPVQACFNWEVTANDRYNGVDPGMYTQYTIQVDMSPGCRNTYWLSFTTEGEDGGWTSEVLDETGHIIPKETEFVLSGTVTYYFTFTVFAPGDAGEGEEASIILHIRANDKYNQDETKDVETLTTVYFAGPYSPDPVEMAETEPGVSWVVLTWDRSTTNPFDFDRYEVHMSHAADFYPVLAHEAQTWVADIDDQDTLTYNMTGLAGSSTYYFQIRAVDRQGEGTGGPYYADSNEESGQTTGINYKPAAVTLLDDYWDLTNSSVVINWTQSDELDFGYYEIHSALTPGFEPNERTQELRFYDDNVTGAEVSGLKENRDLYLKVRVVDNGNPAKYNDSNELHIKTLDFTPWASKLRDAVNVTYHEVELEWSPNCNTDFNHYEVHYSTQEDFTPDATTWDQDIDDLRNNFTTVEELEDDTTYYFKVRTIDNGSNHVDSEAIEVTTPALNKPPVPAELDEPEAADISDTWVKLTWSENEEEDFACYEIYMSEEEDFDIDEDGELVEEEDRASRNYYKVTGLDPDTTYYFKVRTWDEGNEEEEQDPLSSDSNEIEVTTEPLPTPVVVNDPTTITHDSVKLTWSRNTDDDFLRYEVYMDPFSSFNPDLKSPETVIDDSYETEYTFRQLEELTEYYFLVRVVDQGNSKSDSNTVEAVTLNGPPAAVELHSPYSETEDSFTITWEPSEAGDFDYYEVHLSEEEGFTPDDDTLVGTQTDVDSTTFIIEDLQDDTEYFVVVRIYDEGGLFNDSNEKSGETEYAGAPADDDDSTAFGVLAAILTTLVAAVSCRRRK